MALKLVQPQFFVKFDLCCCIMNEVDIRVTTKQSDISSGLPLRGKWTQRVVVDIYGRNGERRGSMQKEEEMDVEYMPDDDILSEEEEESDIFESPQQPQPQGAACSSSSISTNPISIPSPLDHGPLSPAFSHVTSHCSSIMRRFSPVGSWEAVSPMSSGYGSAPRFFSSIGTQTPPATPVFFETRIQLQFNDSHSQDSADIGQLRLRQRLFHQENGRTRFYSEGSQREGASANGGAQALPDVVYTGPFRDRANSAPARPSQSALEAGRELRRISDEFMNEFQGRRNSFITRLLDMWGGRDQGSQRSRSLQEEAENDDPRPNAIGSGSGI